MESACNFPKKGSFASVFGWIVLDIQQLSCRTPTKGSLYKICENTGFHWPLFSRIRIESTILSLYGGIRVSGDLYSGIFMQLLLMLYWSLGQSFLFYGLNYFYPQICSAIFNPLCFDRTKQRLRKLWFCSFHKNSGFRILWIIQILSCYMNIYFDQYFWTLTFPKTLKL